MWVLLPVVGGSPGTEPVVFESTFLSPPHVGVEAELHVRVMANVDVGPAHLRLEVPEWVEVVGGDDWLVELSRGESSEHVWTVVATRTGFWRTGLSHPTGESLSSPVDPDAERQVVNGYHLNVFSSEDGARWNRHPALAIPPARFETRLVAELEGDVVRLRVEAELREAWASLARVETRVHHMGDERSVMELELDDGASVVVTEFASANVVFDRSELMRRDDFPDASGSVGHCRNVELTRAGDVLRESQAWSCEAGAKRSWSVPAPALGFFMACSGLAALGLRAGQKR